MTDDMRTRNAVIQRIAEALREVPSTAGLWERGYDLVAERLYEVAVDAGMVTPDEVMATARYLSAALDRVEELEDGIREHRRERLEPHESDFEGFTYTYDEALWGLLEQEASDV